MRKRAYSLFEIVAWPALVWCLMEVVLRVAARETAGLAAAADTSLAAAATVVMSRRRQRELRPDLGPSRTG